LAQSLLEGKSTDLWKGISKLHPTSVTLAQTVGGVTGEQQIANMWKENFQNTLNSVNNDSNTEFVNNVINANDNLNNVDTVTFHELKNVVTRLKNNKSAGKDGVPAEVYKYASNRLLTLLSIFYTSCLRLNFLPEELMHVILVPLIKNKKKCASELGNYRPIAIATASSKLLELIMMSRLHNYLMTKDNQFGYKAAHGTEMAVYTLKETISYYKSLGSPVYLCFLDARKAFDRVNHWTLLKNLIEKGVPIHIVKLLLYWYRTQKVIIKWGKSVSDSFTTSNGIKQGGLLSPFLFNIYVDCINEALADSGIGCRVGETCMNTISYADDMVLMTPHAGSLQMLVNICERVAPELDIQYNTDKSVCMLIKSGHERIAYTQDIRLNGVNLQFVQSFPYLGHIITSGGKDNEDIQKEYRKLNAAGNQLIRKFSFCTTEVKCQLFKTYCYSIYCNSLWSSFTLQCINKLRVAYNDIFRRLIGVPRWTSASMVFAFHGVNHLKVLTRKCAYSLQQRVGSSNNSLLEALQVKNVYHPSRLHERWTSILYVQEPIQMGRNVL